ncbi:SAM-dependent methyltransferase [Dactylosporangium darangshiense]|uniref:S-adenosyl-L-methionine-dependent methyltransferase n=1 Tax=Dactylosporangium darangshiense TaxID=579108 RepID=A0ABP8DC46_9ACTN
MTAASARWTAAARARESARSDRLFDDPWAALLADGTEAGPENPYLPVRTRYFDDAVIAAAAQHRQLVLLGAGLDTRAWRLPLPGDTTVFEVDRPGPGPAKRGRIPAPPVCTVRAVEADLAADDWPARLLDAGLDPGAQTLWLAEGLLFHLPATAVGALLAGAAALTRAPARFLADVFGTGLLRLESMQIPQYRQNPPFCTDDPAGLFARAGWTGCAWDLAGSPAANYGRLSGRAGTGGADPGMRTYLVAASR